MDGKGEVVVGVAMMLMGENSRTVTEAVKAKLEEMQAVAARGDARSIRSTTARRWSTARSRPSRRTWPRARLLVILVLLLLLGDVRAGLVVAVTIPLSMFFAVTVMRGRAPPET